jgi:D-xylose 1-dehydrogenase (NADP+, D-xylono-1,5-lactone-forming)
MSDKVRWGLLSTANINKNVIPAIRLSKRGELVAVASRSQESAAAYAKEWEIPQAFGSYQEMLASGAVDAVYIGLPNHLHAEWSIKAMQAGVHVLCEKPFAITLMEVDAMIAASKETGMVLAEAFMYRHHPQTKIVGEVVQSGRLGEITVVRGVFNFSMNPEGRKKESLNVRLVPEWGGGCLWDVGVYPLSYAQFVMGGPPEWVFGSKWISEHGVDETFCGQMGYPGGRLAQISSAFRSPFHTHFVIIGTEGRLELNQPFNQLEQGRRLTFFDAAGKAEEIPVPQEYLYLGEVKNMHAAILDGAPSYLTLAETRNHVKTVLALYESAKTGKVIHLQ